MSNVDNWFEKYWYTAFTQKRRTIQAAKDVYQIEKGDIYGIVGYSGLANLPLCVRSITQVPQLVKITIGKDDFADGTVNYRQKNCARNVKRWDDFPTL